VLCKSSKILFFATRNAIDFGRAKRTEVVNFLLIACKPRNAYEISSFDV